MGQWIIRNWGVQELHELMRYCSPIYVLCVSSHFLPFTKANLVLENFNKNLGFGQTPPPLLGKKPKFFRKTILTAPLRSISSMLNEHENCAMMVGGQDGQLSAAHISPWQSISSSQFPPPFCLWRTLLDLKVAEIIPLPTPWLCHCVLMKGSDRGGVTSSKDCLLAFWQIALCGQERGQVARVSFGEAHWTAGGWSTGCGGDWECFPRGTPWSQPFSGVKVDGQL